MMKEMGIVVMVMMVAGCVGGGMQITSSQERVEGGSEIFERVAGEKGIEVSDAALIFERGWGIENENDFFSKLPEKKEGFEGDRKILYEGDGAKLGGVGYESYIQPDYYPTWSSTGIGVYSEVSGPEYHALGISTTPAEQEARMKGDSNGFETTLFMGAAWGVTYYQVVRLYATVEPAGSMDVKFDPEVVLMGPTFPRFDPQWMKKVRVYGTKGKNARAGEKSVIRVWATTPTDEEQAAAGAGKIPADQLVGADTFQPSEGLATLTIHIE